MLSQSELFVFFVVGFFFGFAVALLLLRST